MLMFFSRSVRHEASFSLLNASLHLKVLWIMTNNVIFRRGGAGGGCGVVILLRDCAAEDQVRRKRQIEERHEPVQSVLSLFDFNHICSKQEKLQYGGVNLLTFVLQSTVLHVFFFFTFWLIRSASKRIVYEMLTLFFPQKTISKKNQLETTAPNNSKKPRISIKDWKYF